MSLLKKAQNFLAPLPVILVTTRTKKDTVVFDNLAPIAWAGIIDYSPHIININIGVEKCTAKAIDKTGQFGVCIPPARYLWEVDFCGTLSGNKIDKFKSIKLTKFGASEIDVPLLKECPINMECKLEKIIPFGPHNMYVGKIVATHMDPNFADENGDPDYEKIGLLCYVNDSYWIIGKKLENVFYTSKKPE